MGNDVSQGKDSPENNKPRSNMPPKETIKVLDSFAAFANKNRIDDNSPKLTSFVRMQDPITRNNLLPTIQIQPTTIYDASQNQIVSLKRKMFHSIGYCTFYWQQVSSEGETEQFTTGSYSGSGTLISPNLILTSARLLEQKDKKIEKITFCRGGSKDNGQAFSEFQVKEWIVHPDFLNDSPDVHHNNDRAFAILVLDDDIGIQTGHAVYKSLSDEDLDGSKVFINGFLTEVIQNEKVEISNQARTGDKIDPDPPMTYQDTGKIVSTTESRIKCKISSEVRSLGASLVLSTPLYENLIIGIQAEIPTKEFSECLRITPEIVEWIETIETSNSIQRDRKIIADIKIQNKILEEIASVNQALRSNNPIHSKLITLYNLDSGPRYCTFKVYDPFFKKFYALKRINLIDDKVGETVALKELRVMLKLAKFQTGLKDFRKNQFINIYEIKYEIGVYITYLTELGIGTLSSYNHFRRTQKQPLTEDETTTILNQVYLQSFLLKMRRIYHRDIKPSNLIISEDCYIKLTDFGISEYLEDTQNEFGIFPACGSEGFCPEIIKEAFASNKKSVEVNLWDAEQEMIYNTIKVLYKDPEMTDETIALFMKIKSKQPPEEQKLTQILNISEENRQMLEEFTAYKISHIIEKSNPSNFLMVAKSLLDRANVLEATNLVNMLKPVAKHKKTEIDYLFIEAQVEQFLDHHQLAIEKYDEFLKLKANELSELELAHILDYKSGSYFVLNKFDEALKLSEESLEIKKRVLKEKNREFTTNYLLIAKIYKLQSKFEKSIELFRESFNLQKDLLGPKHQDLVTTAISLSEILKLLNKYEEAHEYYKTFRKVSIEILLDYHADDPIIIQMQSRGRSFSNQMEELPTPKEIKDNFLKIQTFQKKTLDSALCYDNAAWMMEREKNYKLALLFYKKALEIRQNLLGENSLLVAASYCFLAHHYLEKANRVDNAIELLTKALNIRIKLLGEQNLLCTGVYDSLANAWIKKSNWDKAFEYVNKSLEIRIQLFGEESYYVSESYNYLANLFDKQDKLEDAIQFQSRNFEIKSKIFGENSLVIANCYNKLGNISFSQKNFDKSLEYYTKCHELIFKFYGKENTDTSKSLYNIAKVYLQKAKYPEAATYLDKCLKIRTELLGENNNLVALCYNLLGDLHVGKREHQKAIEFYEKCIKIKNDLQLEQGPEHAEILSKLATEHQLLRNNQKALDLYESCVTILRESQGDESLMLATAYFSIAGLYNELKEPSRALSFLTSCLRIRESLLGKSHLDVGKTYMALAYVLEENERIDDAIENYQKGLKIKAENIGESSLEVANALFKIGNIYFKRGNHQEAFENLERSLDIYNLQPEKNKIRIDQIKAMKEVTLMLNKDK